MHRRTKSKPTKSIFVKQARDMARTPMVLVMFIIFPAVAFAMTMLIAKGNDDIPDSMFVSMMAAIFSGMALITTSADIIAEDIERKSLRLLIMAGVKPHQYLTAIGGFLLLAGAVTSVLFALIGGFTGTDLVKFLVVMISGLAASIILGATIGMVSKNVQSATAMGMPLAMIFGFTPMIAAFNETAEKIFSIFYTQQLNVIINDFGVSIWEPLFVIAANIAVFTVLFIIAYRKKGLRG